MNDIDPNHAFDGKQDKNFHQKPFDDVTDPLPQIDEKSASLADKTSDKENDDSEKENQESTKADFRKEINEDDVRDQNDSSQDWEAENSRTSRHK